MNKIKGTLADLTDDAIDAQLEHWANQPMSEMERDFDVSGERQRKRIWFKMYGTLPPPRPPR
jgi:hypothetical protein